MTATAQPPLKRDPSPVAGFSPPPAGESGPKRPAGKIRPVVQIDSREQAPLEIVSYETERVGLPVGDYGIRRFSDWSNPAFIVERKSLNDLIGSLTAGRERFMREIEKMRQFGFRALVIEADRLEVETKAYASAATPQSILATLDALVVRCNLHVFWCSDAHGAARQVEGLVRQFVRGIEKQYGALLAGPNSESNGASPAQN